MVELSPLRRRMIEDMTIRNLSPATVWFSAGHEIPVETRCTWKARTSSRPSRSGERPK